MMVLVVLAGMLSATPVDATTVLIGLMVSSAAHGRSFSDKPAQTLAAADCDPQCLIYATQRLVAARHAGHDNDRS